MLIAKCVCIQNQSACLRFYYKSYQARIQKKISGRSQEQNYLQNEITFVIQLYIMSYIYVYNKLIFQYNDVKYKILSLNSNILSILNNSFNVVTQC